MSKSSTASAPKTSQLPTQSAWARGPPISSTASSSRSQSPAPSSATVANAPSNAHGSHSRRPSALGSGVSIRDGVNVPVPRSTAGASKSAVTFGSIDDAAAPISSSPASAPAVKSTADGVKTFGSVAVQNGASNKAAFTRPSSLSSTSNPSASTSPAPSSTPKKPSFDVSKLFQGPSKTTPTPPSAEASASPSSRPSSLPPAPYAGQPFTPRGQGQNGSNANGPPPRSPSYARPMTNGSGMGARPAAGPGGPSAVPGNIPPTMSSPRLGPHPTPHPGQTPGMPPPTPPVWQGYYYHGYPVPQEQYMHSPYGWQQPLPPQHGHPHPPPLHHAPSGPPGPPPPGGGMPMSPRNAPPQLPMQGPGTPTPAHAPLPTPGHSHAASLTSPPPTPNSASGRLNLAASTFVPGKKISIKDPTTGEEATLEVLRRAGHVPPRQESPAPPTPVMKREPKRSSVRIETEEQRQKRLAQEKEKEQKEKEKEDRERRVKAEAEKKVQEKKEQEERQKKEKEEQAAKEKQEEEGRKKRDEEARVRKEKEEADRKQKEEADRIRKEEEAKSKLEAEEQAKRAEEDKQKEQEKAVAAEEAKAAVAQAAAEKEKEEVEVEVEVEDHKVPVQGATHEKLKPSEKEILRIDTAISEGKKRPGRLDLTSATVGNVAPPPPSALATARIIEDLGRVQYPEGIKSPKVELNVNAPAGKFRYDRDFLMQFMSICKEKPDNLPPLDAIGLEPSDQFSMVRGGSGRKQTPSMSGPPSARQASIGLGFLPASLSKAGGGAFAGMGNFSTAQVSKLSSEERFAMASTSSRSASMGGLALGGRPSQPAMVRTSSQGGPGKERDRTRSKRGEKRSDSNRVSMGHPSGMGQGYTSMGPPLEPVAPLEASANRWVPTSSKRVAPADQESPEIVDRKVKSLLNKLTMERFDSISDQIIQWANKSEKEKDGRTLIQVIRLVFEKATDEATFSEMYARLCRKMMEMISPKVQDDGIRNAEGKPIAGGLLFRKYLLNRCQEDFERGWVQKEATAAAALTKATEDKATKAAAAGKEEKEGEGELYSDEYYAAQKAKRRGLGLIRFIGELFKLQMLTERIMHECIKKLLGNVENPEEEEIESLCKLLITVGAILDTPKAHAHMDVYFSRMKELCKSGNVNSRMQFMLQDVIELRSRNWIPRTQAAAPATIAQIHEAAAKEKAASERESYQRQMSMSRGGSRRGPDRGEQQVGPDGWAVAGTAPRPPPKAGDLSHFGKIGKSAPMTFGPSSVFAGKKEAKAGPTGRETPISRTASTSNMFSMLSGHAEAPVEGKTSRPPSRKPSVDLGQAGAGIPEAPQQRRKLQLLPRSKPMEAKDESAVGSEAASSEAGEEEAPAMSEADALKKIGEDTKEFFSIRSLDEAENYFSTLPQEHRFRLVDKLAMQAVESKEADAQLVADFFTRAREKNLSTPTAFEEGLMPLAELIDDVAIDAPKALDFFAIMLKGAGLHEDEERRARIAAKSMDSDKLLALLT